MRRPSRSRKTRPAVKMSLATTGSVAPVLTTGIGLARGYYQDVVGPLLMARWPGLPHAAARLGSGSDVLGLDDALSRDHDWGLRLTLLVDHGHVEAVRDYLELVLPAEYQGWPTRFPTTWDSEIRHKVEVATPEDFATSRLGLSVEVPWDALDWLSLSGQSVLEVTAGPVFNDTHGGITAIRQRLDWYPSDVWAYVAAADWHRIGQDLPVLGRAGSRHDDLGSRVVTAHVVQICMHLGFLLQRRWPPYSKWMGAMLTVSAGASSVAAALQAAMASENWQDRQAAVEQALLALHEMQRAAGLPTGKQALEPFHNRPFLAVRPSVTDLLLKEVTDPLVR